MANAAHASAHGRPVDIVVGTLKRNSLAGFRKDQVVRDRNGRLEMTESRSQFSIQFEVYGSR